ncbi:hypothetical protein AB4Z29_22595 [Paenibacillus sp. 2TAB23]|uniref:hypothetical protein n=1 Tax=Paenibacillus sp. 2TAB23 TaxID=3233004 RepID=UPI003F9B7C9D
MVEEILTSIHNYCHQPMSMDTMGDNRVIDLSRDNWNNNWHNGSYQVDKAADTLIS